MAECCYTLQRGCPFSPLNSPLPMGDLDPYLCPQPKWHLDQYSPPPNWKGQFGGGKGHPNVKYRDTLWSSVQKRL